MRQFLNTVQKYNWQIKAVNFIAILVIWTWVIQTSTFSPSVQFDLEPVVTFLLSLSSLGWFEFQGILQIRRLEVNRKLAQKLIDRLPSKSDTIHFLKNYDMAGGFNPNYLRDLNRFVLEWDNPEHKFLDRELEQQRSELINLFRSFLEVANTETVFDKYQQIPPEWRYEQPERWRKAVDDMKNLANYAVEAHEKIIITAREKLDM